MVNEPDFLNYYPLIKKVIKLSAITHFKEEIGYLSTTKACFDYVMHQAPNIKSDLILLFNSLEKDITKLSLDERNTLKKSIITVVDFILPHARGRVSQKYV